MINNINSWTSKIIIATVITIIIQMILPNGKNKKYIEIVSSLYILYVILNPILNIDKNVSILDIKATIAGMASGEYVSQDDVAKSYILGMENSLKAKIEELGYKVDYIQFYITADYTSIAKIEVKMIKDSEFDKNKIINLILENFQLDKSNIIISWKEKN